MTGGRLFRIVLAAVVVGGAAALSFCLGLRFAHDASGGGSPGEFGVTEVGTPIAVFSSDPTVRFDLSLTVAPVAWTLHLVPVFDPAAPRPDSVTALVVASEGWHLDLSGFEDIVREQGLEVSYRRGSPAVWLDQGPHDLQLLLVHLLADGRPVMSALSTITAGPGDRAVYRTPAGMRIVVPTIGRPVIDDCTGAGAPRACGVSTTDFSQVSSAPGRTWFGAVGPPTAGSVRIDLRLSGDWQLGAANPRPEVSGDRLVWAADRSQSAHDGVDFEILSPNVARSSQRSLLWAGILFGIGGSLVASSILAVGGIAPQVPCRDPAGPGRAVRRTTRATVSRRRRGRDRPAGPRVDRPAQETSAPARDGMMGPSLEQPGGRR